MPSRLCVSSTRAKYARSYVITSSMLGRDTPCAPFPCFDQEQEHEQEQERKRLHTHYLVTAIYVNYLAGNGRGCIARKENSGRA